MKPLLTPVVLHISSKDAVIQKRPETTIQGVGTAMYVSAEPEPSEPLVPRGNFVEVSRNQGAFLESILEFRFRMSV